MAKRDALRLPGGMSVETGPDWNQRYWIGYRKGCSMFFRDARLLRKWLGLPVGTTSRQAFDSWVASVEAEDAERAARKAHPKEVLSEEHLATGFGPEVHALDAALRKHTGAKAMDDLRQASADVSGIQLDVVEDDIDLFQAQ